MRTTLSGWSCLPALGCVLALAAGARAEERAAPPADAAQARYREALAAEAQGLAERAREAYAEVLRLDPDHAAARRALGFERVNGAWLAGDDLKRARGLVLREGRWLAAEEVAPPVAVPPAADPSPTREAPSLATLVRRALAARDAAARAAAVRELKERALPGATEALARGLRGGTSATRLHAAEALALLGDVAAVPALLAQWEIEPRTGARAFFAQTAQRSYVADFDVEVA